MKQRINIAHVLKVIGWLLMIEGVFMLLPTATSLYYREADWMPLAVSAALTMAVGLVLTKRLRPRTPNMHKREGLLLTASVWVVFSLFGMLPFLLCQHRLSVTDAFFEAMSGFTTTGATTMQDVGVFGYGMHLWRAMMQWIGGTGIIIFTLAVLPMLNHSGGMQMFNAEVTGITHDKIRPRISQTAKGLWGIYLVLTVCCAGLLWLGPMDLYESVCHAFGTVSTGGFSTHADGVCAWQSTYVKAVVTLFMILGGINFGLIYKALAGQWHPVRRNSVLRFFMISIVVGTVLFAAAELVTGRWTGWQSLTIDPLFQAVSAMTSTGYALPQLQLWGAFALTLIVAMMFFGGCAGSTSGGAKIDRLLLLLKFQRNEVKKSLQPNTVTSVKSGGVVIPSELVSKTLAFLCLYVGVIVVGGMLLAALGVPMANAYFSSLSCMSNVGFTTSITSYAGTFEAIPALGKWVLAAIMLIGRLEVYTILVIMTPTFWRR